MPRYSDEWLLDRVLFDFVSGGSCACCGFQHFLPNGTADLIDAVTDLETDQAQAEKEALIHHPWPVDLRDQVWASRVKLRQKLKLEMKQYKNFWCNHSDTFREWCINNPKIIKRLMQVPRSEITEIIRTKYNIHSVFGVVMCCILEQIAFFSLTKYPTDARTIDEIDFENNLLFARMSGFTMNIVNDNNEINIEILNILLKRMETLGGPKLLGKKQKDSNNEEDEDDVDNADADDAVAATKVGSSFQPDRRIARLLIARYWADALIKRYMEDQQTKEETSPESKDN